MTLFIRYRGVRLVSVRPAPVLTLATLTWAGDRAATARLDSGGSVDVTLPNGWWLRPGDRVALYYYPGGWVAVQRVVISRPLDYGDPDEPDGGER